MRLLCASTKNDVNIKHTPGTCECPLFCGFSPTKEGGHVFSINICNTNTYTYIRYILTFLGTNISHLWKRTIIFPAAFKRDTCFFPGGYSIFGVFHDPSQWLVKLPKWCSQHKSRYYSAPKPCSAGYPKYILLRACLATCVHPRSLI